MRALHISAENIIDLIMWHNHGFSLGHLPKIKILINMRLFLSTKPACQNPPDSLLLLCCPTGCLEGTIQSLTLAPSSMFQAGVLVFDSLDLSFPSDLVFLFPCLCFCFFLYVT